MRRGIDWRAEGSRIQSTNRDIFMAGAPISACADDLFGDLASTVGSSESKTKKGT